MKILKSELLCLNMLLSHCVDTYNSTTTIKEQNELIESDNDLIVFMDVLIPLKEKVEKELCFFKGKTTQGE